MVRHVGRKPDCGSEILFVTSTAVTFQFPLMFLEAGVTDYQAMGRPSKISIGYMY